MKDDLSLFTNASIPKPDKSYSKIGLCLALLYSALFAYLIIKSFSCTHNLCNEYFYLTYISSPWSLFGIYALALFHGKQPIFATITFNQAVGLYSMFTLGFVINLLLLYLIGNIIEDFIRKLLSCLPSISKQ